MTSQIQVVHYKGIEGLQNVEEKLKITYHVLCLGKVRLN